MTCTAKKVSLTTVKECMVRGCGCFTDRGYYIQYRNGGVDSLLFVCDSCFERQYKPQCVMGAFDENEYLQERRPEHRRSCPWLLKLIRRAGVGVKAARAAVTLAAVLLTAVWIYDKKSGNHGMEGIWMIDKIMENGFMGLAAYVYLFALVSLGLFVLAIIANAFLRSGKFDVAEIRKLFFTNLTFMLVFALLEHFLI